MGRVEELDGGHKPDYSLEHSSKHSSHFPWQSGALELIFGHLQYGKGSQTGYLNQDVVTLGGYTVNNTVFAAADTLNPAFSYYPISGLFGLGFGTISASGCVQDTPALQI